MVIEAGATTARRYVGDLTAWSRAPQGEGWSAAAAIWSATAVYAHRAQLTISAAKSGVFANSVEGRRRLREADPAAPLLLAFRDLGVQQHAGSYGEAAMAARVEATRARFAGLRASRCRTAAVWPQWRRPGSLRQLTARWWVLLPTRRSAGCVPGQAGQYGEEGVLRP